MAFKEVGGETRYVKYTESEPGQVLAEGTYLGTRLSKFEKPQYQFREETGNLVVLNSSGHLDKKINLLVKVGDMVRVILKDKAKIKEGPYRGKDSYIFSVLIDSEKRTAELEAEASEFFETVDDTTYHQYAEETEEEVVEPPKARVAAVTEISSAKKPSAEEILAKYRPKKA